jgi:hypothetical protein
MKIRTMVIVTGTAATLLLLQRAWPGKATPAAPPASAAAPRTGRLASRVATPEGIRIDATAVARQASPATEELSPQEQREDDDRRLAKQASLLAKTFAADRRDPMWSPQAERAVRDQFATTALAGARLDEASCGATLCRVTVAFDSVAHLREGFNSVVELVRWPSRGFGDVSPDDPLRYVFYASRDPAAYPTVED